MNHLILIKHAGGASNRQNRVHNHGRPRLATIGQRTRVDFVNRNLHTIAWLEGGRRIRKKALPLEAVRESIVNAVVHRDYTLVGTDVEVSMYRDAPLPKPDEKECSRHHKRRTQSHARNGINSSPRTPPNHPLIKHALPQIDETQSAPDSTIGQRTRKLYPSRRSVAPLQTRPPHHKRRTQSPRNGTTRRRHPPNPLYISTQPSRTRPQRRPLYSPRNMAHHRKNLLRTPQGPDLWQ